MNSNDIPPDRLETLRVIRAGIDKHDKVPDAWVEYTDDPEGIVIEYRVQETDPDVAAERIGRLLRVYADTVIERWVPPVGRIIADAPHLNERHIVTVRSDWVEGFVRARPSERAIGMAAGIIANREVVDRG